MTDMKRVGKHATTVRTEDGVTYVKYHNTVVFEHEIAAKKVVLRSAGYTTNTTKTRMNQAAAQFEVPVHVSAHRGQWFVYVGSAPDGQRFPFRDGMAIFYDQRHICAAYPKPSGPCQRTPGDGPICGLCSPNNCVRI